ncbi:MAG: T9SS type A sorting domain-containing protein [Janthinobacterium lividum]
MTFLLRSLRQPIGLGFLVAAGLASPLGALAQTCTGTDPGGNPATNGLYARYYAGYFNDEQGFFANTAPGVVRIDPRLNFATTNSWGAIVPPATGTLSDPDVFSARYQGTLLIATAGTYTLTLTSDDASYLWLDAAARRATPLSGEATINNGQLHGTTAASATVTLTAGRHDLVVHYGERDRFNVLTLQYSGPDTGNSLVVVPSAALCTSTTGVALATAAAQAGPRFAVQVMPNPAAAGGPVRLRVQQAMAAPVWLVVSDVQGRRLYERELPAAETIDVPVALPALRSGGLYLFRLTSAAGTITQKLVVQ